MKILVTGGSGFLGSNLVERLSRDRFEVFNVDVKPPKNGALFGNWIKGDVCDFDGIRTIFKRYRPEVVVHMAARTDLEGRSLDEYNANFDGVSNIIACCNEDKNIQRVIFLSSMLVCKLGYQPNNDSDYCPTTIYGESKVIGEKLVREKIRTDLEWSILRPTSLWGPWFDVPYRAFFDSVLAGFFMIPSGLTVYRSYGFVFNSVNQITALITTSKKSMFCKVYYLADREPIELSEWANQIVEYSGRGKVYRVPMFLLVLAAKAGDVLKVLGVKSPPLTSFRLSNMTTNAVYNVDSWRQLDLEQEYSMSEGVKITVDWINNNT